jgi:hypothetical protein
MNTRKVGLAILISISSLLVKSQDTIKYLFAETFENMTDMSRDGLLQKWQFHQTNYMESSQSVLNLGGEHGKVWHSVYHKGMAAGYGDDGFQLDVPLGGEFEEVWFESDLYADPDFNSVSVTGKYSGKMLFGFFGGNDVLTNGKWSLDSSANGNGWEAQGVWGSGDALRPYFYDQVADGQVHQMNAHLVIPKGYWIHISRRIKMNTPGKKDGIYEIYINDSLRAQATDVEWRSFAQGKDYAKISDLHLNFYFGGGGYEYSSQKDNYIRVDNLIAYYYLPNAKSYLPGPAKPGQKIPRHIPKKDIYPSQILFDEVFKKPEATIKSHYNCGVYPPNSDGTINKEVVRPQGPIKITFSKFDAGMDNWVTLNSYTKIYSGTGINKKLKYTFNRDNNPSGTYTIDDKEMTVEFFAGLSFSKGFALNYTSPRVPGDTIYDNPEIPENKQPQIQDQAINVEEANYVAPHLGSVSASDPDVGQLLTYSIVSGNTQSYFVINKTTGEITTTQDNIFNNTQLEYKLVVKVEDNGEIKKNNQATVTIKLAPELNVVYIDPTNKNDVAQKGTIEHPFASWKGLTWKNGYKYYQKRGTTANEDKISVYCTGATIGSYGNGDYPIIMSTSKDYAIQALNKDNITIANIHIIANDAISSIYLLGNTSGIYTVQNCVLENSDYGVRILDGKQVTLKYNTFKNCNMGFYSHANENNVFYNVFTKNESAIEIASLSSINKVYNNVFYENGSGISSSNGELTLYNNIFYLYKDGDIALNLKLDKFLSDNNIFFPERDGFIAIADKTYNNLKEYNNDYSIDLNSFSQDPQFVDVYNSNFAISQSSPAINAGKLVGLEKDYYGISVPYAGIPDIGISEILSGRINTAINNQSNDDNTLNIYPNPSKGQVNIEINKTGISDGQTSMLKVMDQAGKTVYTKVINLSDKDGSESIDLSNNENGIYYFLLQLVDKTITEKLLLLHE